MIDENELDTLPKLRSKTSPNITRSDASFELDDNSPPREFDDSLSRESGFEGPGSRFDDVHLLGSGNSRLLKESEINNSLSVRSKSTNNVSKRSKSKNNVSVRSKHNNNLLSELVESENLPSESVESRNLPSESVETRFKRIASNVLYRQEETKRKKADEVKNVKKRGLVDKTLNKRGLEDKSLKKRRALVDKSLNIQEKKSSGSKKRSTKPPTANRKSRVLEISQSGMESPLQETQEPTPATSPIPLTKLSNTKRQKPLIVSLERITNDRDKRVKINTIDVLKSLVLDFEPREFNSSTINEAAAQKDFKNHIVSHLDTMLELFTSVNDLTQSIKLISKQKDEVRQKIYELNQQHSKVGHELNDLRSSYQKKENKNLKLKNINTGLATLRSNDNLFINNMVQHKLSRLTKITNSNTGINSLITSLNDKLSEIDENVK